MNDYNLILAKHEDSGGQLLLDHLNYVALAAPVIAENLNLNKQIARDGAILHDIGKCSPLFQKTLKKGYVRQPGFVFRHEIASLFFISVLPESERDQVIEMIVAHHKSVYKDVRGKGLIDLDDMMDSFSVHSEGFDEWSPVALSLLEYFRIKTHPITIEEARENYEYAIDYCDNLDYGYSEWKGVLMASDHLASSLNEKTDEMVQKLFIRPDLSFYNRENELYPLSQISAEDERPHTLVTAPTGAGKTDYLLRRCKGRVFYTLPFQASINAMYDRIKSDLKNTDAQVYLLHAASDVKIKEGKLEEKIMQRHIGASVKVMTPHQMACIAFGIKGYEAMITDLYGCDVILDEIHTYTDTIQAIVLKIVEILKSLECRIHIGTATMPKVLYERIIELLGGKSNVLEVSLPESQLQSFNRHIIYKIEDKDKCIPIITKGIADNKKILLVCNQVKRAQQLYSELKELYPDIEMMLIHSRYKRSDRQEKEMQLKQYFNNLNKACIVVSTQVVEVSLDISFDMMVTECAPIDALIQRFGRINRKRTAQTIGKYKDIYVIKPSDDKNESLPYSQDILKRSFEVLPDGELLQEVQLQDKLDMVYSQIGMLSIDMNSVYVDDEWQISKLRHYPKSALLETLDIDSVACITESDKEIYKQNNRAENSEMEISVSYKSVAFRHLDRIDKGMSPFIIPDKAYTSELGLMIDFAKPEFYESFELL